MKIIAHGAEPGHPRGLIRAWVGWEHVAHRLWPTMEIPDSPYGLLRLRLKPYGGKPVALPDGVSICKNTLIGELHCDNQLFLSLVVRQHINPYWACREDLHSLAAWVRKDPTGAQVEAFFGRTMLAIGGTRLGFSVRELPRSPWLSLERFFMIGLLLLYTESGFKRLTRGTTVLSYPKEVWMTRVQLLRRYGDRPGRRLRGSDEPRHAARQQPPSAAPAESANDLVAGRDETPLHCD